MKSKSAVTVLLVFSAIAWAYDAAVPYFTRARDVTVAAPQHQNYLIVDTDIWKYSRPDLADIRLYNGESQLPYALMRQSGGSSQEQVSAKILNLGTISGHTEFDLDVSSLPEYDRVRLQLDAKNFINVAQIEGRKTPNDRFGVKLGSSTLYDFTAEGLGSNSTLKFPSASFPYLHIRLASGIRPDQVRSASLSNFSETKAAWLSAGSCVPASGSPKQSVFECILYDRTPLERITFEVGTEKKASSEPAAPVNFSRSVTVSDENGNELQSGTISRVAVKRHGETVSNEELALEIYPRISNKIRVTVENGDDAPLPITHVQPLCFERRIYFDPRGASSLRLYYGDPKLGPPSYDYAKFFQQNPDAVAAQLGTAQANAAFTGRPDERPWSDRHKGVLWLAMLIAVALLGGMALRGLKSDSATTEVR